MQSQNKNKNDKSKDGKMISPRERMRARES